MIGLDTNVIVRLVVADDPEQHRTALALVNELSTEEPGFIGMVTLAELHWVLRRAYRVPAETVLDTIESLLLAQDVEIEADHVVRRAVTSARRGADFADALIAQSAAVAGCHTVATFDRRAAEYLSWQLLT